MVSKIKRLFQIIFLGIVVILTSSYPTPVQGAFVLSESSSSLSATQQKVLLIYDTEDIPAEPLYQNTLQALDYAAFVYDTFDLSSIGDLPPLEQYTSVVLATENFVEIKPLQEKRITNYVLNGGGLVAIDRGWSSALGPLFGIRPLQQLEQYPEVGGLQFNADFFPGINGITLGKEIVPAHTSYVLHLESEARVIASDSARHPIAWMYPFGNGRTLFWNSAFLSSKLARGLIVQSIFSVQPVSILPIANVAAVGINGFPAPFTEQRLAPIDQEYNSSLDNFYQNIWLPDMLNLAESYDLPLTFFTRFGDNTQAQAPFMFNEWENYQITVNNQTIPYSIYVAQMLAADHELQIQGFNGLPLNLKNWPSEADMVASLEASAQRWSTDNLGVLPTILSSPGEMLDEIGMAALSQAFPTIKGIVSSYSDQNEFGAYPKNPELFLLPAATSGYMFTPAEQFTMVSQIGNMGVWIHNIEVNDLFSVPSNFPEAPSYRNPNILPWRGDNGAKDGFYYQLQNWLEFNRTHYPWLRYMGTEDASVYMQDYLLNTATAGYSTTGITLSSSAPTYFQVRINGDQRLDTSQIKGAETVYVEKHDWYSLYTLKGIDTIVDIPLVMAINNQPPLPTTNFELPVPGELLISEFMVNTSGQEWFEIFNQTDNYLNLAGLKLVIGGREHIIDPNANLRIEGKGYAILAQTEVLENSFNSEQIFYIYGTDLKLGDADGIIQLKYDETILASLTYDIKQLWPIEKGISVGLSPDVVNTESYSHGMSWCQSVKALAGNPKLYGTPGEPNHSCARTTVDPLVSNPALAVQSGELVIVEAMLRTTSSDEGQEWFEVYNPTDEPVSLSGVTITVGIHRSYVISEPIVIEPYAYLVLAQDDVLSNQELPSGIDIYHYDLSLQFHNKSDAITLRRRLQIIDSLVFDETKWWPLRDNVTMSLDPHATSAYLNDDAFNWCYGSRKIEGFPDVEGTPGVPNDPCPMWGINPPLVDNREVYEQDILEPIEMHLTLDPADLEYMITNPFENRQFPCQIDIRAEAFDENNSSVELTNCNIRIRGASSRRAFQKNFRIDLLNGDFREQDTLNLNRHMATDSSRMKNHTGFALLQGVEHMVSMRTQFVHLYINGKDFGLHTQVEDPGKRFLRSHSLDERSSLFKAKCFLDITCFNFQIPSEEERDLNMMEGFSVQAGTNQEGIIAMLDDLHSDMPINTVIDRHFNRDNLVTFLASMYLIRQLDVVSQNFYLYSTPREPSRFYFIPWDLDGAFATREGRSLSVQRWWRGFGFISEVDLWHRFLEDPRNVDELLAKIDELYNTSLNPQRLAAIVDEAVPIVEPFISSQPEIDAYLTKGTWLQAVADVKSSIATRYNDLATTIHYPLPVFVNLEIRPNNTLLFLWDPSASLTGDSISYELVFFSEEIWSEDRIIHRISNIPDTRIEMNVMDFPAFMHNNTYYWLVYIWDSQGNFQTSYTSSYGIIRNKVTIR